MRIPAIIRIGLFCLLCVGLMNNSRAVAVEAPVPVDKSIILDLARNSALIVEGRISVGVTRDGYLASLSVEKVLFGTPFKPFVTFVSPPDDVPAGPVIVFFSGNADPNGKSPLLVKDKIWMVGPAQEGDIVAALQSVPPDSFPSRYQEDVAPRDLVDLSRLPSGCRTSIQAIKRGITRGELAKDFGLDGGMMSMFRYERYALKNGCTDGARVIKLTLQFKPADADNYSNTEPLPGQQSPRDTVWSVSLPYYQAPTRD